ncbi:MAG: ribonuclease HII [Cyclobacteriaceae bacterium]|nr:ribonuclease HII [Cyclobacteriaceae bacterium]
MPLLANCSGKILEAGCDEVGRGCLAGPVVAAAVILPANYNHPLLNDSKQLSARQRLSVRDDIYRDAVCFAIAETSNEEVDQINVLQASFLAMHRALDNLPILPEYIIVDGHMFKPYEQIPHKCIIGGDARYLSIAAASVLAKTYRDELMEKLSISHPEYGWNHNVGYPTKTHREAILQYGITSLSPGITFPTYSDTWAF